MCVAVCCGCVCVCVLVFLPRFCHLPAAFCYRGCRWDEPDWGAEDGLNQAPINLFPVATVSGLTPGVAYVLLRFDSVGSLPATGNFLAAAWAQETPFVASGAVMTLTSLASIRSDGTYFYRCVRAM